MTPVEPAYACEARLFHGIKLKVALKSQKCIILLHMHMFAYKQGLGLYSFNQPVAFHSTTKSGNLPIDAVILL